MSNTELWDKLGRTDPAHTKTFKRAGGFEGTAVKPMWSYKRMTEEFGPCGRGWGINRPSFQLVNAGDEIIVYCTVTVWYGDKDTTTVGVGGDKVAGKNKYGPVTDDEAFKKAFTDAVTNALKFIGVGADVHMGMFDDNKYVNSMRQEFAGVGSNDEAGKTSSKPKAQSREIYSALEKQMRTITTTSDLAEWWKDSECRDKRASLPEDWHRELHEEFKAYGLTLKAKEDKQRSGGMSDREAMQSSMAAG